MIEIKDLGFGVIEIFDKDTQYAPAQSIKIGNNTYIREDLINKQIADLQSQLAEKDEEIENAQNLKAIEVADELSLKLSKIHNQDKISFAVDILEELADCSNYINSKLDFESGSYVSEKSIRDKIKYLKGKKDE